MKKTTSTVRRSETSVDLVAHGVTRAEALGVAGAALGGIAAGLTVATSFGREAYADEASGQGVSAAADDPDEGDYNPYSGVAEDIEYVSNGDGHVSSYAVPQVTYADERAANPKRVLVVVDYQVDFVDGGVFGRIEPAVAIEDALCAKIQEYRDRGDIIVYTMDTHPADDYAATREATVNPPHCDPATEGWQLYGKVRDLLNPDNATLVMKGTYGSPELPRVIEGFRSQGIQIESVEFAGVSTTCRVLHNAIIVYNAFPELPMIMDAATTASYTDERTEEQLEELEAWGFIVKR